MNIIGLIISYLFIGGIVAIGFAMAKSQRLHPEVVRKFIHITVSNWWFLLLIFFDSFLWAIIGPITFILMNGAAVFTGFAKALGERSLRRNLGLVYFPMTLAILVFLVFKGYLPMWAATIGVFTMGYGDGFAALIGRTCGKRKLFRDKSVLGSAVMFAATVIVIYLAQAGFGFSTFTASMFFLRALLLALLVTVVELFTPANIDNLSVPLITSYLAIFLMGPA